MLYTYTNRSVNIVNRDSVHADLRAFAGDLLGIAAVSFKRKKYKNS